MLVFFLSDPSDTAQFQSLGCWWSLCSYWRELVSPRCVSTFRYQYFSSFYWFSFCFVLLECSQVTETCRGFCAPWQWGWEGFAGWESWWSFKVRRDAVVRMFAISDRVRRTCLMVLPTRKLESTKVWGGSRLCSTCPRRSETLLCQVTVFIFVKFKTFVDMRWKT